MDSTIDDKKIPYEKVVTAMRSRNLQFFLKKGLYHPLIKKKIGSLLLILHKSFWRSYYAITLRVTINYNKIPYRKVIKSMWYQNLQFFLRRGLKSHVTGFFGIGGNFRTRREIQCLPNAEFCSQWRFFLCVFHLLKSG